MDKTCRTCRYFKTLFDTSGIVYRVCICNTLRSREMVLSEFMYILLSEKKIKTGCAAHEGGVADRFKIKPLIDKDVEVKTVVLAKMAAADWKRFTKTEMGSKISKNFEAVFDEEGLKIKVWSVKTNLIIEEEEVK